MARGFVTLPVNDWPSVTNTEWAAMPLDSTTTPQHVVQAVQVFTPGAAAQEVFTPGATAHQVFTPGAQAAGVSQE